MILYWIFYSITLGGAYFAIFALPSGNTMLMIISLSIAIVSWLCQVILAYKDDIKWWLRTRIGKKINRIG